MVSIAQLCSHWLASFTKYRRLRTKPASARQYLINLTDVCYRFGICPSREISRALVIGGSHEQDQSQVGHGARHYGCRNTANGRLRPSIVATVGQKAAWPRWVPPKEMVARDAFAAKWADGMPGGPTNPLGARALYLFVDGVDTLYRIHGSHQPGSIGRAVSSGCVRLLNVDVIDLYEHVEVGTRVVVLQPKQEEPIVASQQATKKALLRQRWQRTASRQSKNQIRLFKLRQRLRERQAAPSQLVRKTNFNLP
jgi:hypothetical protein